MGSLGLVPYPDTAEGGGSFRTATQTWSIGGD
jgi:hypothetical protein